jgi:hypothetical protein
MRYGDSVTDRLVAWVEAHAWFRSALPWGSGLLVALGMVLILTSLGGGSDDAPTSTAPTATISLEKAAAAALEYQSERVPPTFEGFNVTTAEGMEPSLTWVKNDPSASGDVAIRVAKSKNLLLIATEGGVTYCLALDDTGGSERGKVDAQKTAECSGGW